MAWIKNVNTNVSSNSVVASIAKLFFVISSLVFFFVACGGDSGSSTKPVDDGREVATVVEMGRCTNEREGDTVYVAEKMTDYLCKNRTWVDLSTVSDNENSLSSSSVVKGSFSSSSDTRSAALSSSAVTPNSVSGTSSASSGVIGLCGTINAGVVSKFNGTYYICRSNAWETATVLEYDTYGWNAGVEGSVKAGKVNSDKYYVYENGAWRASSGVIENNLGACVTSREGEVGKSGNSYYICKNKTWTTATALEYDTYGWNVGSEGDVKVGSVNKDKYYVYETGAWRASSGAIENNLGACVTSREGEVGKSGNSYYICKNKTWTTATTLEYDTYGWNVGSEGDVRTGSVNKDKYYVYETGAWRASSGAIENNLGACVTSREGEVGKSGNSYYICKNKTWTTATALEYDTYGWNVGSEGDVKAGSVNKDKYYVYENGAWRASASEIENDLGACVMSREGEVGESGNTYYICKNKDWTISQSSSSSARLSSSSSSQNAVDPSTVVKGTMIDSRDDQIYKTVKIGSQNWMAENLNYETANSFCYNNLASNCTKYGRLYTWAAAMDSAGKWSTNGKGCGYYGKTCIAIYPVRGVCPKGWHLPTITEWNTLFSAVGGQSVAGVKLKSTSGWSSNGNGSDSFGFSALPAGFRHGSASSRDYGYITHFWSADAINNATASNVFLRYDSEGVLHSNVGMGFAFSVRCLENSN